MIVPCLDGEVVTDLLAFAPADPCQWWLRCGEAAFVGADALERLWLDEPLLIYSSPLDWLKANAPHNGLVILDWSVARRLIPDIDIIVTDIEFGCELDKYPTVQKIGNIMETIVIEKNGPVAFMVTTTKSKLHPENEWNGNNLAKLY